MNNLTFTEEYTLCILDPRANPKALKRTEPAACMIAAELWELYTLDLIRLDENNKVAIIKEHENAIPSYLELLYDRIASKKPRKIFDLIGDYIHSLSGKLLSDMIKNLTGHLVDKGLATPVKIGGRLSSKTLYEPDLDVVDGIIEKTKNEILNDKELTEEMIVLIVLLREADQLRYFFKKDEKAAIKARIKEIQNTPSSNFIIQLVSDTEDAIRVIYSSSSF